MGKMLEIEVVANRLNISRRTVRRWLESPKSPLKGFKTASGTIRIDADSVEKCLVPIKKCLSNGDSM